MKKITYLLSLFFLGMGLTAGAASVSENTVISVNEDDQEADLTTVTVSPEPGEIEDGLPTELTFTFSQKIEEISMVMVRCGYGRGTVLEEDCYSLNEEGKVLTVNVPEDLVLGNEKMTVAVEATDVNGKVVVNDEDYGYIMVNYTTTLPDNTYECEVVSPMDQMIVSSLNYFEISFSNSADDMDYIGGWDTNKQIVLKDAEGSVVARSSKLEVKLDEDGWETGTLMVTLDRTIDAAGAYRLEIPEGLVYNSLFDDSAEDLGVDWGAIYNPEAYFLFTVSSVKVDKVAGEYEDGIPQTITLTFPEEIASVESIMARPQYTDMSNWRGIVLTEEEGVYTIDGNTVTINLPAGLTEGQESVFLIIEVLDVNGMAYAYDSFGKSIELLYTTDLPDDRFACVLSPSPDEVQEELSEIELTFVNPGLSSDVIGSELSQTSVVVYDETGREMTTATLSIKPSDNGFTYTNVVVAKLKNVLAGVGQYSFSIPEKLVWNSLYDDGADDFGVSNGAIYNPAATFVYTIAQPNGIEGVDAASQPKTIYNLAGQKLRETDLSKLSRGVYIVNGKKVVVK